MKVYVVVEKQDYCDVIPAVFKNRKSAEEYMIREAAADMDYYGIPEKNRICEYEFGQLMAVGERYELDVWYHIEEHEVIED